MPSGRACEGTRRRLHPGNDTAGALT
jgi:hypothetical protein